MKEVNLKSVYKLYESNYILFGKGKTVETPKRSVVNRGQGLEEGIIDRAQIVYRVIKYFTWCIMMDTCHYMFLQTHSIYNTETEP